MIHSYSVCTEQVLFSVKSTGSKSDSNTLLIVCDCHSATASTMYILLSCPSIFNVWLEIFSIITQVLNVKCKLHTVETLSGILSLTETTPNHPIWRHFCRFGPDTMCVQMQVTSHPNSFPLDHFHYATNV